MRWQSFLITLLLTTLVSGFWGGSEEDVQTNPPAHQKPPVTVKPTTVHVTPRAVFKAAQISAVPLGGSQNNNQAPIINVRIPTVQPIHNVELQEASAFDNIIKQSSGAEYIAKLLKQFAANREPFKVDAKKKVQDFIYRWFSHYGLHVEQQEFSAYVALSNGTNQPFTGKNIIGFLPGRLKNTVDDRLLVIAAHYDTKDTTHGIGDNGAGVAAMLDIARQISARIKSKNITLDRTVMFAALDFQIKEYDDLETVDTHSGAYQFIRFMDQKFLTTDPKARVHAIILDSVLNYRPEVNTQFYFPRGFAHALPQEHANITAEGSKGDFLTAVYLSKDNKSVDWLLVEAVQRGWDKAKLGNQVRDPYRLRHWPLFETSPDTEFKTMYQKQGQEEFWYYKDTTNTRKHIPAILLTDTGDRTRNVKMICMPSCDNLEKQIPQQIEFLRQLIDSLVNVVVNHQSGKNGCTNVSGSVAAVVLGFLAYFVLSKQD